MRDSDQHFKRPEITRNVEFLAQEQRKMLEEQKRNFEFRTKNSINDFNGLVNSKVNLCSKLSSLNCYKKCNEDIHSDFDFNSSYRSAIKNSIFDENCFRNCVIKNNESFTFLLEVKFI